MISRIASLTRQEKACFPSAIICSILSRNHQSPQSSYPYDRLNPFAKVAFLYPIALATKFLLTSVKNINMITQRFCSFFKAVLLRPGNSDFYCKANQSPAAHRSLEVVFFIWMAQNIYIIFSFKSLINKLFWCNNACVETLLSEKVLGQNWNHVDLFITVYAFKLAKPIRHCKYATTTKNHWGWWKSGCYIHPWIYIV